MTFLTVNIFYVSVLFLLNMGFKIFFFFFLQIITLFLFEFYSASQLFCVFQCWSYLIVIIVTNVFASTVKETEEAAEEPEEAAEEGGVDTQHLKAAKGDSVQCI